MISIKQKERNFLYTRGDTLSKTSDGCVTWSVLPPWAMGCDFKTMCWSFLAMYGNYTCFCGLESTPGLLLSRELTHE